MQEKSKSLSLLFRSLLFLLCCSSSSSAQSQGAPASSAGCSNQQCGELVVRYPFALVESPACPAFSPFFQLQCDASSSKLFLELPGSILVEATHITSDSLIVDASMFKATFNDFNCSVGGMSFIILEAYPGPFVISNDNHFGGFGCSLAVLVTMDLEPLENYLAPTPNPSYAAETDENSYPKDLHVGGCWCSCLGIELHNPDCGYRTCCTSQLPPESAIRAALFFVQPNTVFGGSNAVCDSNHSYTILFHPNYTDFENESYRIKLNWALPTTETDENRIMESSDYACSSNASITIVHEVPGYLCSCPPGFTGDGYSKGSGCTDVNECILANDCVPRSTCHNQEEGNYICRCNHWFYSGDGRMNGSGCRFSLPMKLALMLGSVGVSIVFMISCCIYFAVWLKGRTKRQYFVQNGGLQFQAFMEGRMGREATRLFTAKELERATNNYSEGMKLGAGGSGAVFKGVLNDGKMVAIKRSKNMGSKDGNDSELFLNELAILTQINHRHIVRLLGCCLETKVPLIVYEYVSNGNVAENLAAKRGSGFVMSWEQRLKVACQAGEALAYLHAAASPPILHRDVKSANVLLDDNLDAIIADFGFSRLIPEDAEQVATAIQGTIGYLDPEYFFTLQLTDKSDVYSFGVMLAELITGLKAIDSRNRDTRFANLALLFIETYKKGSLDELIDSRLGFDAIDAQSHIYPSIIAVSSLARHCLATEGSARPSMNKVAHELRGLSDSLQAFAYECDNEVSPLLYSPRGAPKVDYELGATYGVNFQGVSESWFPFRLHRERAS